MTTEKIISVLETTKLMFEMSLPLTDDDCDRDTIEAREDNEETIEAINEAIKAIKHGDILDKIRVEIEQNAYPIVHGVNNHEKGMTLYGILKIIDKHRTGQGVSVRNERAVVQ